MAKLLIFENEVKMVKQIKEALSEGSVTYEVTDVTTLEDLKTQLNGPIVFDLCIIAASALPPKKDMVHWLQEFKPNVTKPEHANLKYILAEFDTPNDKIYKLLKGGWSDFVVKPYDFPLLHQKLDLHLSKSGTAEKQVYSLQVKLDMEVAMEFKCEEISEFGATFHSNRKINLGELVFIHTTAFSEKPEKPEKFEILGRCYNITEATEKKGEYKVKVEFIGVDTRILKLVRSWLRKEYVAKKQAENG